MVSMFVRAGNGSGRLEERCWGDVSIWYDVEWF
jgi:hypothetical protein